MAVTFTLSLVYALTAYRVIPLQSSCFHHLPEDENSSSFSGRRHLKVFFSSAFPCPGSQYSLLLPASTHPTHSRFTPVSFSSLHPRSHCRPGKRNFSGGSISGVLASYDRRANHACLARPHLPRDALSLPTQSISSIQCRPSSGRSLGLLLPIC